MNASVQGYEVVTQNKLTRILIINASVQGSEVVPLNN